MVLQALAPSHADAAALHVLSAWPSGTAEQTPTLPGTLQAWQTPVHAVSQQTLSTQAPPLHWLFVAHAAPGATFAAHVPALQ